MTGNCEFYMNFLTNENVKINVVLIKIVAESLLAKIKTEYKF